MFNFKAMFNKSVIKELPISLDKYAKCPVKTHASDAGFDLFLPTYLPACVEILDTQHWIINTGVHVDIPKGYYIRISPRSSTFKRFLHVEEGIIDEGYTGPIKIMVSGRSKDLKTLKAEERIAQMIISPYVNPLYLCFQEKLRDKPRGSNGFGSTGK